MAKLDVVLLTGGVIGVELAQRLLEIPEVGSLTVVTTKLGRKPAGWLDKARGIHRLEGPPGLLRAAAERIRRPQLRTAGAELAELLARRCPGVRHLHYDDYHRADCLDQLRALAPDLGVVVATYLLRSSVFAIPRLGCLNLHMGRAPEFRGSSPGFYEMLEGVPEVGVTIHRVSDRLDAGGILLQEGFPLDLAPAGDPVAYLQRYQREVLVPNGARMMADAVARLARGEAGESTQDLTRGRTRRRATYAQKQELRRVVAGRRKGSATLTLRSRDS